MAISKFNYHTMQNLRSTFKSIGISSGVMLLFLLSAHCSMAQGDLMVFPKRIIFEGATRTNELNLANIGKDTARYNISFVQYRMNDNGSFTEITVPDEGQNFSDKFLRYYPRSIVLAPKESQIVKIQLTKTDQLVPGEYRSHIYFRAIPNLKPLGEEEKKDTSKSLSVKLIPVFGITIPAIIKVGESTTKAALSDLEFSNQNDTIPVLNLKFNRTGNMSIYGDLTVAYVSTTGKMIDVGRASGIAVYTPNKSRTFQLPLAKNAGVNFHAGKLHVEYIAGSDSKPAKFAEADLPLR